MYHIRRDKSEYRETEWWRSLEDLYTSDNCDSAEVDKVLRECNQLLQVLVDVTVSQNSATSEIRMS